MLVALYTQSSNDYYRMSILRSLFFSNDFLVFFFAFSVNNVISILRTLALSFGLSLLTLGRKMASSIFASSGKDMFADSFVIYSSRPDALADFFDVVESKFPDIMPILFTYKQHIIHNNGNIFRKFSKKD